MLRALGSSDQRSHDPDRDPFYDRTTIYDLIIFKYRKHERDRFGNFDPDLFPLYNIA